MANGIYGAMTELQAINYAFQKNSMSIFILNNITEEHFTTYKDHYNFLKEFNDKYHSMPSKETFQGKFNDNFEWIVVTDPEEYLVSKLREAKLYRDIIYDYKSLGELIKGEKTDVAVSQMATMVQKYFNQSQSKCVDLVDDVKLRYDSYIERMTNPSTSFVSTGLKELDDILGGWDMKNETALICARTGIGKSWAAVYFAMQAAKTGLNVGYYSGEMEPELVGYRFDTFFGNLSNGSLTHGNQDVKFAYEKYTNSLPNTIKGHLYCITPDMFDGSVTVSKLRSFIEKYNIQMLVVDQFSLLDDEKRARTPREQAVNISKDLRTLQRLKKIPMIIAVQLNREESETGPSTRNISESDRIGQDATTVLFIERKGENLVISVGKSRSAKTGDKLTYAWNVNKGILRYIPTEKDARGGTGSETLESEYNDTEQSDSVF